MKKLDKRQKFFSMLMPAITFIWGAVNFFPRIGWDDFGLGGLYNWWCIPIMLLGGVLPAFLTLRRNIDTSDYVGKRCAVFCVIFLLNVIAMFISIELLNFLYRFLIGAGSVVFEVMRVHQDDTPRGERAVMILSCPYLYITVHMLLVTFCTYLRGLGLV